MRNRICIWRTGFLLICLLVSLSGCGADRDGGTVMAARTEADLTENTEQKPVSEEQPDRSESDGKEEPREGDDGTEMHTYQMISQEAAKELMDSETDLVILDVREADEYAAGHIAGAVLMPYTQAEVLAPTMLPDRDRMILVYCRSGRRSKIAAQILADMGYTDVREFGGIIDWPYEVIQ